MRILSSTRALLAGLLLTSVIAGCQPGAVSTVGPAEKAEPAADVTLVNGGIGFSLPPVNVPEPGGTESVQMVHARFRFAQQGCNGNLCVSGGLVQ